MAVDKLERIRGSVAPLLDELGTELYDLELATVGTTVVLRLLIDREGGVDLDAITNVTRAVNPVLDELDGERGALFAGRYTLEVSSPGLERPLRRPAHFERARGSTIAVKTATLVAGQRRHQGVLQGSDGDGIDLLVGDELRRIALDQISSAHTVFEWGPAPRPTRPKAPSTTTRGR
jgi:ribosome maturation factor RimP